MAWSESQQDHSVDKSKLADLGFDASRLKRVEDMLRGEIEAGRVHGTSMRISRRGQVILDFKGGHTDDTRKTPLGDESVFFTLSVAKSMTNVLALSLVERGLLRLHAPVVEVLPDFGRQGKEKITLFHLLTHTAGMMSGFPPTGPEVWADIEKSTAFISDAPVECPPGEQVSYSMVVATTVVAAMCLKVDGRGRKYATMLKEDLWDPLGMKDTSLGRRDDLLPRLCPLRLAQHVPGEILNDDIIRLMEWAILEPWAEFPAGGALTTMNDLHRFTEMLRRGGLNVATGRHIISPAMIRYCAQNFTGDLRNNVYDPVLPGRHWLPFPANIGVGFFVRGRGVYPSRFGVLSSPSSFGGFGAGSTGIWVDPERDLSFTLLSSGLLEETHFVERTGLLSDMVISAMTE